jgi:hypothetical protein
VYYWTVIPKRKGVYGKCLSGTWTFNIQLPMPSVILTSPKNGSTINTSMPTLLWHTEYEGVEQLKYDLYLGNSSNLELFIDELETDFFSILTKLDRGSIYYWKIVPFAGIYQGKESEIWSFSIKEIEDNKPRFKLDLRLDKNEIEILKNEIKFITASVTNIGDIADNISIRIELSNNSNIDASVYNQNISDIESGLTKDFLIMISVNDDYNPGNENCTVIAISNLAEKYGFIVKDDELLTVHIKENYIEKKDNSNNNWLNWLWLIIITSLIISSLLIYIILQKKKKKQNEETLPETEIKKDSIH